MKTFFLVFFLLVISATAFAGPPASPLEVKKKYVPSKDEQTKLLAGETVVRSHQNNLLGGTAFVRSNLPAWRIWQALTDYPKYPEFFPRNVKAEVFSRDANTLMLKTVLSIGPSDTKGSIWNESRIHHYTEDPASLLMTWNAEKTSLQFNFGFWYVEDLGKDRLLIYQNNFGLRNIAAVLARGPAETTLRRNLEAILARAQNSRYDRKPGKTAFAWE